MVRKTNGKRRFKACHSDRRYPLFFFTSDWECVDMRGRTPWSTIPTNFQGFSLSFTSRMSGQYLKRGPERHISHPDLSQRCPNAINIFKFEFNQHPWLLSRQQSRQIRRFNFNQVHPQKPAGERKYILSLYLLDFIISVLLPEDVSSWFRNVKLVVKCCHQNNRNLLHESRLIVQSD